MSIAYNSDAVFVPIRESRRTNGTLSAVNAELVLALNGDQSVLINIDGSGATLNATYVVEGTVDGTTYFPLLAYAYTPASNGATIGLAPIPTLLEAVNTTSVRRVLAVATGGLASVRVRLSAWSAGVATVTIISDPTVTQVHPNLLTPECGTHMVTVTAAAGAIATCTLPAVTGLRHYLTRLSIVKFNAAVLTAAATPVLVTTTNLPGTPSFSFPADAAAQGTISEQSMDFGHGLAATAIGTATTIVGPVTTNVIWRINATYRLGI
jgi:hypothetical protein